MKTPTPEPPDCELYEVGTRWAGGVPHRVDWCNHPKHSPKDRETTDRNLFSGGALDCRGIRGRCPLSDAQFSDRR